MTAPRLPAADAVATPTGIPAMVVYDPAVTPLVWRAGDVAAYWNVSKATVQRWQRNSEVIPSPRTDPGGKHYWLSSEVIAAASGRDDSPASSEQPVNAPTQDAAERPTVVVAIDGQAVADA